MRRTPPLGLQNLRSATSR